MRLVPIFVLAFTITSFPAAAQSLDDLAFMAGCYRAELGPGASMEEFYTTPSDNLILGTTRYLRDGRATQFEFATISERDGVVELLPYPGGSPSEHAFRLTRIDPELGAVFEAPEHDFPKRIIYRAIEGGGHVARIDGGEGSDQVMEWRLEPAGCGG
jgi:hypothetical protein